MTDEKKVAKPSGASGGSVAYRTFDDWHSEVAGFAMRCECLEGPTDELRAAFAAGQSGMRLTDEEREAILSMACYCQHGRPWLLGRDTRSGLEWVRLSAILRGLLERLGGGE